MQFDFDQQVSAPFQVLQPSSASNIDTVFSSSHYHGVVPAESTIKLKVICCLPVIMQNIHQLIYKWIYGESIDSRS